MPMDLERMRVAARRAALVGGDAIRAGRRPSEGEAKGLPGDWVTEVDVASEAAIRSFLDEETPDIAMLGEESGGVTEGLRWIVDPLDGTTNFLHRFPAVGVSVALVEDQAPSPARSTRRSSATRGMPRAALGRSGNLPAGPRNRAACPSVRRNGRWSGRDSPSAGRTGFRGTSPRSPGRSTDSRISVGPARRVSISPGPRAGSSTVSSSWGSRPWDVAAGGLLVEEAGGRVTDWEGGADYLSGDILAGSPAVHDELRGIAGEHGPA